jgi:hypothetical protein
VSKDGRKTRLSKRSLKRIARGTGCACQGPMGPSRGGEFAGKWSISRGAARIIAELGYCERSFNTGAPGVVTEVKPRGMLWMMSAAWRNLPPGALWRAPRALLEGRSVARTNKFTLLDDVVRVSGGAAAEGWVGDAGRRQRLTGIHDPGGECRHLFGADEGPAEAGAKQESEDQCLSESCESGRVGQKWVSRHVVADLLTTCISRKTPIARL